MYIEVLESREYEDRRIEGIFKSPQTDMKGQPGKWSKIDDEQWENDLDFDNARIVTRYKVID